MTVTTARGTFTLKPWQLEYLVIQQALLAQAMREQWAPLTVYRIGRELVKQLHETHVVEEEAA